MAQRLLRQGRRERRVDRLHRPLDRTQTCQVDQVEAWVRRGLGQQQHRSAGYDRCLPCSGVGTVDEGHVDAEPGAHRLQQHLRARVQLVLADDVVTGRTQAEHHRSDRAHPRAEGSRRLGALELGDRLLEGVDGRVAVAAVERRGADRSGHAAAFLDGRRHECRRRPQHRRERRPVGAPAGADGDSVLREWQILAVLRNPVRAGRPMLRRGERSRRRGVVAHSVSWFMSSPGGTQ